jgi:hypothetical protein
MFAAELAATNCAAKETVLVCPNCSDFVKAAASANSIDVFQQPPTASDLIALAAGDQLSELEYIFARVITNKDFIQLSGFRSTNDQDWQESIAQLRNSFQKEPSLTLPELVEKYPEESIVKLSIQIATSISRQTPVIIDGTRALLAASIVFDYSVAARSWLFVADCPQSPAGNALFKHRNWISLPANQIATGDGLAGIAAISLARTAALLIPR